MTPDNRQIAEAYYNLALVQEFSGLFAQAVNNLKAAIAVLETRLALVEKKEEAKGKEASVQEEVQSSSHVDEVKDIKELMPEIMAKIEDLETRLSSSTAASSSTSIDQESTTTTTTTTSTATTTINKDVVNDVSSLIKSKKRAAEEQDASTSDEKKVKVNQQ